MPPRSFILSLEKIFLYLVFVFFIALTIFFRKIPFFWDENYYISTAHHILDSDFTSIIPPLEADRGNFPFYGFYMALWWQLSGKSLLMSHIAILPLLLGIVWEYYCLAKKFLSEKWIPLALLLLVLEPTFITQSILMGHDLFLIYFFLLSANAVLDGKKILYIFSLCLLALHNIKGIPPAFSLFLFYFYYHHFVVHKRIQLTDILIHILPALLWIAWMSYHKHITNWYLFTPVNDYGNTLHFSLFGLKRIVLEIWQIIDFGRAFLWIFIMAAVVFYWRKIIHSQGRTILLLLSVPLIVQLLFYALLDISLCHRYHMVTFLISLITAIYLMEMFIKKIIFRFLLVFISCCGLITGNFWIYGGGFSNGWDSSLKVLPYFNLKNEMDEFVKEQKLNPEEIGTKFPLYHDIKYSEFSASSFHFTNIDTNTIQKFPYILLSNVSNDFTVSEKKILNNKWQLQKEMHSGLVYLKLFRNPSAR